MTKKKKLMVLLTTATATSTSVTLMMTLTLTLMSENISSVTGQEMFDANNLANVPMDMSAPLEYPDPQEELMKSVKLPMKNREGEISLDDQSRRNDDEYGSDDSVFPSSFSSSSSSSLSLDDDFDDIDADDSLTQANTSTVDDEDDDDDMDDDLFDDNSDTFGDFMTASGIDDGESRNSLSLVPSVSSSPSPSEFTSRPSSYVSNPSPSPAETLAPAIMSRSSPRGNARSIVDSLLFSNRMSQVTPAPASSSSSSSSIASFLMSNMPHPTPPPPPPPLSPINANLARTSFAGKPNSPSNLVTTSVRNSFNNMLNQARERGFSLLQPLESAQLRAPPTAAPNTIVVSPTIALPFASAPGIVLLAQMDNSSSSTTTTTTTPPPPMYDDDDDSYSDKGGGKGSGKEKDDSGGFTICPFQPPPQYVAVEKIIPVPRLKIYEEDDENEDHHDYAKAKKDVSKDKKGYTQNYYNDKGDEGKLIILAEDEEEKKDKKKKKEKKKKKDKKKEKDKKEKKCKKGKCSSSHILVAVDESGHSGHYR